MLSHTPYEFAAEHCLGFSLGPLPKATPPRTEFSPGVILQI